MASSSSAPHSSITSLISPFPAAMEWEKIAPRETSCTLEQVRFFGRASTVITYNKKTEDTSIYTTLFLNKKDPFSKKIIKFLTKDYLIFFLKLHPSSLAVHVELRNGATGIDKIFKTLMRHVPPALDSLSLSTDHPSTLPPTFADLLQACPALTYLRLGSSWTIEDTSVTRIKSSLSKMTSLRKLSLENVRMSEKTFVEIFEILAASGSELTTLKLTRPALHKNSCQAISSVMMAHPNFKTLTLLDSQLTREQIVPLFCGILLAPSLSTLNLKGWYETRLKKNTAAALSLLLSTTSSLTSLELPYIETEAMIVLKDGLKENSTLSSLELTFTECKDPEDLEQRATAISEVIKTNTSLTDLALSHFSAQHHWFTIADALIANPTTLCALRITESETPMGDEGAVELARALRSHSALCHLDLDAVSFEEEGYCAIARSLHHNITLSHLILPRFIQSQTIIHELSHMLEQNQSIEKLSLRLTYDAPREPLHLEPLEHALSLNSTLKDLNISIPLNQEGIIKFIESIQTNISLTNLTGFVCDETIGFWGAFEVSRLPEGARESLDTLLSNNRLREFTLSGILYRHLLQTELE
jgi:hypothetical protein